MILNYNFSLFLLAMAISVPFIVLTIFVYLFIPELRNLHGKCLISYLTSLAVGYSILSTITLSEVIFNNFVCSSLGKSLFSVIV